MPCHTCTYLSQWRVELIFGVEQKCIEVPTHQNVFITHQIIEPTT